MKNVQLIKEKGLIQGEFVSEWGDGQIIETNAKFRWESGEIVEVDSVDVEVDGGLIAQYLRVGEELIELEIDENLWDEKGELFVASPKVYSKNQGEFGYVFAIKEEPCGMRSCKGSSYQIIWNDGEVTACCSDNLIEIDDNVYRIAM